MTAPEASPAPQSASWRPVGIYCALAFALAWLVCLPLWLGDGLLSSYFQICAIIMMFTPTVAALITVKFVEKAPLGPGLDLKPRGSAGRMIGYAALALVVMIALCFLGLISSNLLGTFRIDPEVSAFKAVLEQQLASQGQSLDDLPMPIWVLWLLQFVNIIITSLINTIPAAGEEIGWRGYLFPRLRELTCPLGALLISGVVWGLWHAPLILLGYNYPGNPLLGTFVMIIPCIGLTALFAWFAERGGAVWPAAVAHGAFNAAMSSSVIMVAHVDSIPDTFSSTLLGWGGWPVFVIAVPILLATGALRRKELPKSSPAPTPNQALSDYPPPLSKEASG